MEPPLHNQSPSRGASTSQPITITWSIHFTTKSPSRGASTSRPITITWSLHFTTNHHHVEPPLHNQSPSCRASTSQPITMTCRVNRNLIRIPDLDQCHDQARNKELQTVDLYRHCHRQQEKVKEEVRIDLHPHPLQGLHLDLVSK